MVLNARRVQTHNLLVLFGGKTDHRIGLALRGALQIADGAQVDASQQTPCVQVVRVAAHHVLGLAHGVVDVSGAGVEFSQRGGQVGGVRIVASAALYSSTALEAYSSRPLARRHILIDVPKLEVVVGVGAVGRLGLNCLGLAGACAGAVAG